MQKWHFHAKEGSLRVYNILFLASQSLHREAFPETKENYVHAGGPRAHGRPSMYREGALVYRGGPLNR